MSYKILIVDDDADLVDILTLRLVHEGLDVTSARDGVDALDKLLQFTPDVILMDIMMPRMNGYKCTRKIKEDETTKRIPVIMLTAKSLESDKSWGLASGADDYIVKPFEAAQLIDKINTILEANTAQSS